MRLLFFTILSLSPVRVCDAFLLSLFFVLFTIALERVVELTLTFVCISALVALGGPVHI